MGIRQVVGIEGNLINLKDFENKVIVVVNVASRLEQANKKFGTNICISEEIFINLTKNLHDSATMSGEINLKGRSSPSKVYAI